MCSLLSSYITNGYSTNGRHMVSYSRLQTLTLHKYNEGLKLLDLSLNIGHINQISQDRLKLAEYIPAIQLVGYIPFLGVFTMQKMVQFHLSYLFAVF